MDTEDYKINKLGEDEEILLVVKKHWFILFIESLFLVAFIVLPVLFYFFVNTANPELIEGNKDFLILGVSAASVLMGWIVFFIIWTDYYLDSWLITNKRIIDIEQKGLFHRDVATLKLGNIQDATFAIEGIFATAIGFGEVRIQSAGTRTEFKITHVPNPKVVAETILKIQHDNANR